VPHISKAPLVGEVKVQSQLGTGKPRFTWKTTIKREVEQAECGCTATNLPLSNGIKRVSIFKRLDGTKSTAKLK